LELFSFRRPKLSDDELRDALFEAVAASNTRLVKKLAASHLERIIALFPAWKILPPTWRIRSVSDQNGGPKVSGMTLGSLYRNIDIY